MAADREESKGTRAQILRGSAECSAAQDELVERIHRVRGEAAAERQPVEILVDGDAAKRVEYDAAGNAYAEAHAEVFDGAIPLQREHRQLRQQESVARRFHGVVA